MDNVVVTKQKIYQALQTLPPDALKQVERVVDNLQSKATKPPVKLEGFWKDIPFDIDIRTIRRLRRELGREILKHKI
jgi:hypothetical protein